MRSLLKFFAFIFTLLTLAALGHDIWRAHSTGNEFALSQVGGLFQAYAKEDHDIMRQSVVDTAGAETFNDLLVPFLSMHTVVLTGGLLVLCLIFLGLHSYAHREKEFKFKGPRRG